MKPDPKVAIIILNWNGMKDTAECLESLRKTDYAGYQVVLVDNASGNQEGLKLKQDFPEIHLIQNTLNRGFAGGNNDGMNWAIDNSFDYIVNLNNDCFVESDWLSRLVTGLKETGADFASSMIMYYPEKELICSDGDGIFFDGSAVVINHLKKIEPAMKYSKRITCACGAGSVYSKECLLDIRINGSQFFDELYFAYLEDIDLGLRLSVRKYKGLLIPDAVIYHKGSQTSGSGSVFQRFITEKNRSLNIILNYPCYLSPVAELFFIFKMLLWAIAFLFIVNKKARKYSKGSPFENALIYLKVKWWVLGHLKEILNDRRQRKKQGLCRIQIFRYFFWDLTKIIAIAR